MCVIQARKNWNDFAFKHQCGRTRSLATLSAKLSQFSQFKITVSVRLLWPLKYVVIPIGGAVNTNPEDYSKVMD